MTQYRHAYTRAESVSFDLRWAHTYPCLQTIRRPNQAGDLHLKIPSASETNRNPKAKAA